MVRSVDSGECSLSAQRGHGTPSGAPPWYERTMRWVQLLFVENDPGRYDVQW